MKTIYIKNNKGASVNAQQELCPNSFGINQGFSGKNQVKLNNFNSLQYYSLQKTIKKNATSNRRNKKMAMPIKKYKSGQIEAAIWENEREVNGNIVSFRTVSLRKSWMDKENIWRDATIQLRRNDLQKVILVLQKVQEELLLQHEEEGEDEDE